MSFDDPSLNKVFKDKFDFPFDLLSDVDKVVSLDFGVTVNEKGNASRRSVLLGPAGQIIRIYGEVKPAEHADQVLMDLEQL